MQWCDILCNTIHVISAHPSRSGLVESEEFTRTNFPNQYRTLEECKAPFGAGGSASSLRLEEAETELVRCPYFDRYLEGGMGAEEHAERYVPTTRTWSNSTFIAGLSDERSPEEKDALVDELFSVYQARVAENPAEHAMDYVHSYLRVVKDSSQST